MAPRGRIRNPAPNVINDNINETKGFAAREERSADRSRVIAKNHEVVHLQKIPLETRITAQFSNSISSVIIGSRYSQKPPLFHFKTGLKER